MYSAFREIHVCIYFLNIHCSEAVVMLLIKLFLDQCMFAVAFISVDINIARANY